MIDRYLLRYFLAVIDSGNFSKAAVSCNVAQPTLSIGIARMEQMLGKTLFNRTSRRVELTDAGVMLARHARRIEAEFAAAEREITGVSETTVLRIGILLSIPSIWIEDFLVKIAPEGRHHRIEVTESRERDLLDRLARGRIDVALSLIRPAETRYQSEHLFTEGYALAIATTHPLSGRREIEAGELADSPMIVRRHCEVLSETSRFFTARGVRPIFAGRTMSDNRAMQYVRSRLGITLMPDCFECDGVERPKLKDFGFERQVGLLFAAHCNEAALRAQLPLQLLADTVIMSARRSNGSGGDQRL